MSKSNASPLYHRYNLLCHKEHRWSTEGHQGWMTWAPPTRQEDWPQCGPAEPGELHSVLADLKAPVHCLPHTPHWSGLGWRGFMGTRMKTGIAQERSDSIMATLLLHVSLFFPTVKWKALHPIREVSVESRQWFIAIKGLPTNLEGKAGVASTKTRFLLPEHSLILCFSKNVSGLSWTLAMWCWGRWLFSWEGSFH